MTHSGAPIRVLVVDDDFMVAKIHRRFVEQVEGFVVVSEARTGAEALQAVADLGPDLVLLDIYLPDMSGLEVLRRLRQEGGPVDVLVVTAARDVETVKESIRGGAVQYLIKPFTAEVMRDRLLDFRRARSSVALLASDGGEVGQRQVDEIFGASGRPASMAAKLPKGLSIQTLRLVVTELRAASEEDDGTLSASECAVRAGLARVSTRRYLEHLAAIGYAEVSLKYGGAGRPERRFRWIG
jgi:response regulator of citrate/malate metabolism